eukprot:1094530-Pleurochrysis_carterae.AAC.1
MQQFCSHRRPIRSFSFVLRQDTTACDAATASLLDGTTSAPTGKESVALPVVASTFRPTCASVAKRPRLMRFCDALCNTSTFLSLILMTSPFSVGSGMSTLQRYLGVVVPLAVTVSVEFGRRLPFTANEAFVMQCMPAPVSPSHIVLALAVAIAGVDSMMDAYTACASASPRRCAK